jgi:hypothetical protein
MMHVHGEKKREGWRKGGKEGRRSGKERRGKLPNRGENETKSRI